MLAFINSLSPWHLLLLAGLALLFYGNRLPEVARSLGKAVNEFKRGLRDVQDEIGSEPPTEEPKKLQPPTEEHTEAPSADRVATKVEHADTADSGRQD